MGGIGPGGFGGCCKFTSSLLFRCLTNLVSSLINIFVTQCKLSLKVLHQSTQPVSDYFSWTRLLLKLSLCRVAVPSFIGYAAAWLDYSVAPDNISSPNPVDSRAELIQYLESPHTKGGKDIVAWWGVRLFYI